MIEGCSTQRSRCNLFSRDLGGRRHCFKFEVLVSSTGSCFRHKVHDTRLLAICAGVSTTRRRKDMAITNRITRRKHGERGKRKNYQHLEASTATQSSRKGTWPWILGRHHVVCYRSSTHSMEKMGTERQNQACIIAIFLHGI